VAMTELTGPNATKAPQAEADHDDDQDADHALLQSLIQGRTNAEIAQELGVEEGDVVLRLGELFAKIGASSRAEATAFAFRERVL
jgi:DNA-binding NarL/FixJ family response regulator